MWIVVLSIVTPCSLVGGHQRFDEKYLLHLQEMFLLKLW
jgi:hypothetical protein